MRALAISVALFAGSLATGAAAPRVFPSGNEISENVLRISIAFAEPTVPGVLERLQLRAADGTLVADPFLQQELWSPDGKTITLFLHPGRVKSGLRAHAEVGRALRAGDHVALLLDGEPLKTWRVGPARTTAPDPRCWIVRPPAANMRDAVVVSLDAPIDAQAVGYIAVVSPLGERVPGRATLVPGEVLWRFAPETPWAEGEYRILIHPRLEDPQGNALGNRFEQKAGGPAPDSAPPAELRFRISGTGAASLVAETDQKHPAT
jgi:hypothetical protein